MPVLFYIQMGVEDKARLACLKNKTVSIKDMMLGQLKQYCEMELKAIFKVMI